MTKGTSLLYGLLIFSLGAFGYLGFRMAGFEGISAGIAAEILLFLIIVIWIASYLIRVLTGKMTFMEQRRRYRANYADFAGEELQNRFESMNPKDQESLLKQII
uniref:DUF3007 domain-containing protein n=1 Tax=Paulinella chromatophora TaxID=39717 RepID=B1X3F1_PAUCH|nr:hypothetical protein PCC_0008 [Paulinella chromatophora]ACB42470.1 hypothetical protein PCC_0008 [Paulinella chromatophora]